LNTVVPADVSSNWLRKFLSLAADDPSADLAVMQLARRTRDRWRDIPAQLRDDVLDWLTAREANEHYVQLVREGGTLDVQEQGQVLGESLPKGLRIR
jgi:hypothetical protein